MPSNKPKPTSLKLIDGNRGKRPLNKGEPKPRPAANKTGQSVEYPKPPNYLDRIAKAKWRELIPELDRLGLLTVVDLDMFALYCEAHSDCRRLKRIIQEEGETFTNDKGEIKRRPETTLYKEAVLTERMIAVEFGLSPSSRSRIDVSKKEEADGRDFLRNATRAE